MGDRKTSSTANKGKERAVEVLEVEDEEQRQARMHDVFARLDTSSSRASPSAGLQLPNLSGQSSLPLEPNTELLSRVQAFLPQLAESNADLARRAQSDPRSVDIENIDASQAYIEMNLGLGVLEQRRNTAPGSRSEVDQDAGSDADSDSESSSDDSSSMSSSESDSIGSDSSTDDCDSDVTESLSSGRPTKPLPRRKPKVTVVGERSNENAS